MCYWLHGAPPPEQGGRFGVPQGSFPSPSGSRSSPGRPCDPGFCSRTAHKNLAFLLGPKPSSQRRPFSRIASGWLEAAAALRVETWRCVVGAGSLPSSPALLGASEVSPGAPSPQPSPERPGRGGCASLSALPRLPPASLA